MLLKGEVWFSDMGGLTFCLATMGSLRLAGMCVAHVVFAQSLPHALVGFQDPSDLPVDAFLEG